MRSNIERIGYKQVITVEHLGHVGAGTTVDIFDHPRAQLILRPQWVNDLREVCTVTVSGDSLVDENIFDGDILVVKRIIDAAEVRNGRLVVATLPTGRAVVKRIHIDGDTVRLRSANPAYEDLVFDAGEIVVDGIVRSIVRDVV